MTDYEMLETDPNVKRLLRQEELIMDVTEALVEVLQREGLRRATVASRLGKSKAFVTQALASGRNLTLRTIADMAGAMGYRVKFGLEMESRRIVGSEACSAWSESDNAAWSKLSEAVLAPKTGGGSAVKPSHAKVLPFSKQEKELAA